MLEPSAPNINPEQERYFTHGSGQTPELPFESEAKKIDHGTRAWAPGAIFQKNRYEGAVSIARLDWIPYLG